MTDTSRLAMLVMPALLPDTQRRVRQQVRTSQVVGDDGNVLPESLSTVTAIIPERWFFAGTPTTGTNKGGEYRLAQAATSLVIDARVKTAPTGGEFQADVLVSGVVIDNVSIAAGEFSGTSVMNTSLPAGGVLTVNLVSVNGAADATVSIYYRPRL